MTGGRDGQEKCDDLVGCCCRRRPRRTGSRPTEAQNPGRARPSFIETDDGASLFHVDWGTGKPVLFTHAWGLNADIWEYQLVELADQGLRCVAYDRRGHGRSSDPGRGYDYDRLADDLAAVINQLDLTDVTLVAHSMGNGEAVRYLRRHGSARIARLVMLSTIPPQSTSDFSPLIAGLKQDRPAFFAKGVAAFTGGHPAVSPAMTEWIIAQFMRASPKGTIDCMHSHRARRLPRGHARRHRADLDRPWRQGHGQPAGHDGAEGRRADTRLDAQGVRGCATRPRHHSS